MLADADFDLHCLAVDFREHAIAGFLIDLLLTALLLAGLSLRDVDVVVGRRRGQLAGQEVVAGEAVGDVLDVAGAGRAFYLFEENDSHDDLLQTRWGNGKRIAVCPLWVITGCSLLSTACVAVCSLPILERMCAGRQTGLSVSARSSPPS